MPLKLRPFEPLMRIAPCVEVGVGVASVKLTAVVPPSTSPPSVSEPTVPEVPALIDQPKFQQRTPDFFS